MGTIVDTFKQLLNLTYCDILFSLTPISLGKMNGNFMPGSQGSDKYPVYGYLPAYDTPFTRIAENWTTDQNTCCKDYEMDFVRCQAKVGVKKAINDETCLRYWDDLLECRFKLKTRKRYMAMLAERQKQKRPLLEKPPMD